MCVYLFIFLPFPFTSLVHKWSCMIFGQLLWNIVLSDLLLWMLDPLLNLRGTSKSLALWRVCFLASRLRDSFASIAKRYNSYNLYCFHFSACCFFVFYVYMFLKLYVSACFFVLCLYLFSFLFSFPLFYIFGVYYRVSRSRNYHIQQMFLYHIRNKISK